MDQSRRAVIGGSVLALTRAAAVPSGTTATEATVRRYYKLWEGRDWPPFDAILADDFTFTSPNGDDHIGKTAFKSRCWESQKDLTDHFDIGRLAIVGDTAFVQYLGHTTNGRTFGNVEVVRIKSGRIAAIDCYFGANASFPSAVSTVAH